MYLHIVWKQPSHEVMKEMLLRSKFFLHFGINHQHVIRGANSMFENTAIKCTYPQEQWIVSLRLHKKCFLVKRIS